MTDNNKPINGVCAAYVEHGEGNPFRDALPPFRNEDEIIELFLYSPDVPDNLNEISEIDRFILVNRIDDFRVPSLKIKKLAYSIYALLDESTTHMTESLYWLESAADSQQRTGRRSRQATTGSMLLMGMSGVGKTTAVEEILQDLPQVILHEKYQEHKIIADQIVYLIVDCPPRPTLTGFLRQILLAIDKALGNTSYLQDSIKDRVQGEDLLPVVVDLLWEHHVSILVLDEVNHLAGAGIEIEALGNTMTTLTNMAHTPVIFCGTYRFRQYVQKNFRDCRRFLKLGDPGWDRLKEDNAEWEFFCQELWELQYTLNKTEWTPELSHVLYEGCQGIKAIAIALFKQVQRKVILDERNKKEIITVKDLNEVIHTDFSELLPMLEAIRDGNVKKMLEYEDLYKYTEEIEQKSQKDLEKYQEEKQIFRKNLEQVKKTRNSFFDRTLSVVESLLCFEYLTRQDVKRIIRERMQDSALNELKETDLRNVIIKELLDEEEKRSQLRQIELKKDRKKLSSKDGNSLQSLYSNTATDNPIGYKEYQKLGKIGQANEF